jgi:hypothetical protein
MGDRVAPKGRQAATKVGLVQRRLAAGLGFLSLVAAGFGLTYGIWQIGRASGAVFTILLSFTLAALGLLLWRFSREPSDDDGHGSTVSAPGRAGDVGRPVRTQERDD